VPQRIIVGIMSFLALLFAYTHRVSLSHVITQLVVPINRTSDDEDKEDVCPADDDVSTTPSDHRGEYRWSEQMQGIILSCFYIGYIITHMPGGILSDKFGAKWVLLLCMLISALCTMLCPLAIIYFEEWGLIVDRVIMGAAQGTMFPAVTALLSAWVPARERGSLGAFTYSGVILGTVVSNSCSGVMLHYFHWSVTLIVFGGLSIVWCIVFLLLCTSRPDEHPCMKPKELSYLIETMGDRTKGKLPIPWKKLLLSKALVALIISQIGHDWGYYVMITCLPKYISDVIRFSIRSNGFVTALPFLAMFISSNITGFVTDFIIRKGLMSISNIRKLLTFLAALGPGALMVAASYAGCDKFLVIALFTMSMFVMGLYYAGQKLTPMDMSPSFSGTLTAISNGLGSLAGILSPTLVGFLTPNATMSEWRIVFWIGLIIMVISAIIFAIWGTAEVQPYDPSYKGEKKDG
ncbi:hypothetical protein KR215_004624, partial [Drosophila sulfurigaster]